jgi:hypothetical protein
MKRTGVFEVHRVVIARIGDKKIHLLKTVGVLIVLASLLGVLDCVATLSRTAMQVGLASEAGLGDFYSVQVFGLDSASLTDQVVLGFFMLPMAFLLLWISVLVIGVMVYRSGGIIIEEESVRG